MVTMTSRRVLVILLWWFVLGCRANWDSDDDPVSTVGVDAVLGRSVTLPCDIEPTTPVDRVYMVLWFRDSAGKPLYSFDVRGRPFTKALYWSDSNAFGPRAYFVTGSKPAGLTLESVQLDDEGIYRCRVDFKNSPTRNFQINLTVIVPPHQLLIYENSGRDVSTPVVGPLTEGSDLVLTCEVRGGKPTPTVSWFVNDKLVDGLLETTSHHVVVVNRLEVSHVTREHLNTTYKCQASNTKLMLPAEKTVRLELYLKPLSVRLLSKPEVLTAGAQYNITCEAVGSRPQAKISWHRGKEEFQRGEFEESSNETVVMSTLTFIPEPDDDAHVLKCRAENPMISGSGLEDSLSLNVVYPPQVTLQLGNKLNPDTIKENDDVYFECNIRANPKKYKITWLHNNASVTQNMSSGVILSTHSLVLQGVTRHNGGSYTCLAANSKGETSSKPVNLRVQFAPVCKNDDVTVVGASLDEALRVRCHVTADPGDVTFVWQFNNSGESFELEQSRIGTGNGSTSDLSYTPKSERDYGSLACWGRNAIGRQAEPCIFQIVPAAKPGPLRNCTLRAATNQSTDALEVECVAGYDGGLPQRFVLEAYESRTMRLRLNVTSDSPLFRLDLNDLLPAHTPTLHIVLYASNPKGRSEVAMLEDIALKDAEKRTESVSGEGGVGLSVVPLAALLTGAVFTLGIAVLLVAVLAVRRRRDPHHHHHHHGAPHQMELETVKQQKVPPTGGLQPASRHNSLLEINHGEHRYVVSYTLKSAADCGQQQQQPSERQPDILNTPRATDTMVTDTPLQRPEVLFPLSRDSLMDSNRHLTGIPATFQMSPGLTSPEYPSSPATTPPSLPPSRSKLADKIPLSSSATNMYTSNGTVRKDHIISNTIPGPESCV